MYSLLGSQVHSLKSKSPILVRNAACFIKTIRYSSTKIQVIRDVPTLRAYRRQQWRANRDVGFVPTMGALHQGHLSLAQAAATENPEVVVSIFVNPTQFGVNEDLASYPKTFDTDMLALDALNDSFEKLGAQGRITTVFAPTSQTMYPTLPPTSEIDGKGSFVTITPLGSLLEGASRPVFFRGVATVCMKLFNIVQPTRVYFGQKDGQQTVIIKRLVKDFHLDTEVRIIPTEREEDGLAMSSRNVYLGTRRRREAVVLSQALFAGAEAYMQAGIVKRAGILGPANQLIATRSAEQTSLPISQRVLFELDYISLADTETMEEVETIDVEKGAILSGALKMLPLEGVNENEDVGHGGGASRPVRLIDNIVLPGRRDA